jgi:hypothetical protein
MIDEDVSGWQPISTAPRDKTVVLLAKGRDVECGFFDPDDGAFGWVFIDPSVREHTNGWRDDERWGPTHWMPLPGAPS